MKKMRVFGALFAVLSILIGGCADPPAKPIPPKPINMIVILDTSDRISAERKPEQAQTDIAIAEFCVSLYYEEARRKLFNSYNRIAFVAPPQPDLPRVPQAITKRLKIWPTREDRRLAGSRFEEMRQKVVNGIDELYQFAGRQDKFTGSDIWVWFRDSAEVYLRQEAINYIICLSDGYLDFNKSIQNRRPRRGNKTSYIPYPQVKKFRPNPNWTKEFHDAGHGLLEIGKDFSNYDVRFLMVEIDLRDMLDLEIIEEYWRTWLESMGILDAEFLLRQDNPQIVKERIQAFTFPEKLLAPNSDKAANDKNAYPNDAR